MCGSSLSLDLAPVNGDAVSFDSDRTWVCSVGLMSLIYQCPVNPIFPRFYRLFGKCYVVSNPYLICRDFPIYEQHYNPCSVELRADAAEFGVFIEYRYF